MSVMGPRLDAAERTDVDDTAAVALGDHPPGGLLAAKEDRFQVDGVDKIPILFSNFERIDACEAASVVDETIQAAEVGFDFGEESFDLRNIGKIRLEGGRVVAKRGGFPGFRLRGIVVNGNAGAFARKAQGDAATDAFGGSGYKYDFVGEQG